MAKRRVKNNVPMQEQCAKCGYTRLHESHKYHLAPLYGEQQATLHEFIVTPPRKVKDTTRWRRDSVTGERYRSGTVTYDD